MSAKSLPHSLGQRARGHQWVVTALRRANVPCNVAELDGQRGDDRKFLLRDGSLDGHPTKSVYQSGGQASFTRKGKAHAPYDSVPLAPPLTGATMHKVI